jgi:uncharacterized coiled-coil DUF342 family protein
MRFVPLRLFRFLHVSPVDIEKHVKTHFEEHLLELTSQNNEYYQEVIQLKNQIIQISDELNKTKQLLDASKNKAEYLEGKILHLTERGFEKDSERKDLSEKLEEHRYTYRLVVEALTKLGAKDPNINL